MKWTTLHASNYHMGWILVQNCVRPCTRVCVRGMSACMACVHIFASCMYRQYGSGRTSTFFWNQQHVTVINPRKEVAITPPHVPCGFMNCKRHCVACHWYSNLRVLHILEVLVRYTCIACIRFCNQIMNKYHTIACKLLVIYAWCSHSFNSYCSSHSKSN